MSSKMPTDTSQSLGSNFGLDGYPDLPYGEGLEHDMATGLGGLETLFDDGAGPTSLPDGHVTAADGLGDLSHMVRDATLSDLSWLEVEEQDLERLPKDTHATAIPELEAQWSENRGEAGIHFYANVDPDVARYRESLDKEAFERLPRATIQDAIRKAMRLSVTGHTLEQISEEVNGFLLAAGVEKQGGLHPDDDVLVKQAMQVVADEHGLAGRVFIRADAFPGYEAGRWTKTLRKHASGARYIVVPKNMVNASHHHDGWCAVTKKQVVTEVPWKQARSLYTPILKATGRTVGASGDPKAALRSAFEQKGQGFESVARELPRHIAPSERVTAAEAKSSLASAKVDQATVDRQAMEHAKSLKKAQLRIAKWAREGLLTKSAAAKLVKSDLEPSEMLRRAAAQITKLPDVQEFSGIHNEGAAIPKMAEDIARERLAAAADESKAATDRVRKLAEERTQRSTHAAKKEAAVRAKVAKIAEQIEKGLRGQVLANALRRTFARDEVKIAGPMLDPILKGTNALAEPVKQAREFSGPRYTEAPMTRAAALTPSPKEVQEVVRWARLKLSEGLMGDDFDTMLKLRFAKSIRVAAAEQLQTLRDEHEGLAGNVYVDASAYASKKGTDGCDQGAMIHRANGIRNVLAMDRCNGCAFANALPDGKSVCSKYNKALVSEAPVADKRAAQREAIRMANSSDAEKTASLFASGYDPSEFDLQNSNLDSFDYSHTPTEKLGEVLFGDTLSGYLGED